MISEFRKLLHISIWLIDGTLTDSTTPGQREPGSNDNEGIRHSFQSSRTGASQTDEV